MVSKEKDDELALFLQLRRLDKDKNNSLLFPPQSDVASGVNNYNTINKNMEINFGGSSPISKIVLASTMPTRKTAAERFLDSENDKSDYDWLITPPGTPLFPSSEMESQKSTMSGMSNARATALTSRLTNILAEPGSRTNSVTKRITVPSGLNTSTIGVRRPSSSGGQKSASRQATPTGRPTLPVSAKYSRSSTPISRATLPSSKPAAAPGPARSSTPTRATARSSTPTRATARSSTPTARPSLPASRSASRPATPTRQPLSTSSAPVAAAPHGRSSSVTKSVPATSKNAVASRGSSPTIKSRPWKPNEIPGFSLDAPPNLRTSLPERPASATRSRPGERSASATKSRPGDRSASTSRSRPAVTTAVTSSAEATSTGRRRQQSCSPSRGRVSNGSTSFNRISIPSRKKEPASGSDDVNPVLMGTKMVERVVNMRKLAPPKQDDSHSAHSNSYGKSSSLDSGFGRSLSKKSLDMAMRHMDIRRSISGNIRSLVTSVPASSMYSVRSGGSGSTKSRTISIPDSPLATCSNASSEPSVNNNSFFADVIEIENDLGSGRGNSSPTSQHGR